MFKKALLTLTILILNLQPSTTEAHSHEHHQNLINQGEIHGIFNLYTELNGKPAITRAKELDGTQDIDYLRRKIGTYYQDSGKIKNTTQKALFAYQYLLKIASHANFKAFARNDDIDICAFEKGNFGFCTGSYLIRKKDIKTVYPQLMELIKTQTPINFNLGYDHKTQRTININRHQSANLSATQTWKIASNYSFDFALQAPEHKALLIYAFLLELSLQTNFKVYVSNQFEDDNAVMLNIETQRTDDGTEIELIPDNEVDSVYPTLIEFMQ